MVNVNKLTKFSGLSSLKHILFIDCHMGEYPGYTCFEEWDPEQIVGEAASAGADALCFFAKDHFGNCYCELPDGHIHKDISSDYTGQIVEAARRRQMAVIVYYSVWADLWAGQQHPEWSVRSKSFQDLFKSGFPWSTLCHNTGFTEKIVIPHLKTIISRYNPDGIYLDTMNWSDVCRCPGCRKAFRDEFGDDMPDDLAKSSRQWKRVFAVTWNRAMQRLYAECAEIKPDIEFFFAVKRICPELTKDAEEICALDNVESNLQDQNTDLGIIATSLQARYHRTTQVHSNILLNAFNGCWGEATVKNPVLFTSEMAAARANGVRVNAAEYLRPWGKLEPHALNTIKKAYESEALFETLSVGFPACRHIAVLDDYSFPRNRFTSGAGKLLIEAHQQFDIIDETKLDNLSGYKLLWVPPVKLWQPEKWRQVLGWVEAGGILLLEAGAELSANGSQHLLYEALEISRAEKSPHPAVYLLPENEYRDEIFGEMPLLFHEDTWNYEMKDGRRLVDLLEPVADWNPPEIVFRTNVLPPNTNRRIPGIMEKRLGQGRILLLPGSFSGMYFQHHYAPVKRLVARLLETCAAPPFTVTAPPYVEVNMLENGKRSILHFVQYCLNHSGGNDAHNRDTNPGGLWAGERYHDIEWVNPVCGIPVKVRCENRPRKILVHPGGTAAEFDYADGWCRFTLPRLDLHSAVEIIGK
jgi:hypothetical protein